MSFDTAFAQVIGLEGKYSDDERDPGNWTGGAVGQGELRGTMYGISAAAYPKFDIKSLTLLKVKSIYLTDYWDKIHGDLLPAPVSVALFKAAVNMGISGAVKALQRAIKVDADGVLGQVSIGMIVAHPPMLTLQQFLTECAWEYTQMAAFPTYGKGWLSRVIKTALETQLSSEELAPDAIKG